MMIERQIIFDSANVRAIWQPSKSDSVVVVFNELGTTYNSNRFWGDEFFAKNGISAVGIVTPIPNWYPEADMRQAASTIRAFTVGRRVLTYGFSQGAYGAIKWSAKLGAEAVLAFCPQISIDPNVVRSFDGRYTSFFRDDLNGGLLIEPRDVAGRIYVVYDHRDRSDKIHASMIQRSTGAELIICPFSGHDTIRLVSESGTSSGLMDLFLGPNEHVARNIRNVLRNSRCGSSTYRRIRAIQLLNLKRIARAKPLLEHLPSADREKIRLQYAFDLLPEQELNATIANGDDALVVQMGLYRCWNHYRQRGMIEGESRIADLIVKTRPDDGFLCLHSVNTYIESGKFELAAHELRRICGHFDIRPWSRHISAFAEKLGLSEIIGSVDTTER